MKKSVKITLIVAAAVAVLVATIWMPVLQIYGSSMTPTLREGDIVVSIKESDFAAGDLVAFYIGNKILVKRCIALPGQWVDMDENGSVYVDGRRLEIQGGDYELCPHSGSCCGKDCGRGQCGQSRCHQNHQGGHCCENRGHL